VKLRVSCCTATAEQDLKSSAFAVLDLLQGMASSNNPAVSRALKYVRNVRGRVVLSRKETEQNISDILLAIEWLLQSNSDLSAVRLMLDELLQGWESRYYFEY